MLGRHVSSHASAIKWTPLPLGLGAAALLGHEATYETAARRQMGSADHDGLVWLLRRQGASPERPLPVTKAEVSASLGLAIACSPPEAAAGVVGGRLIHAHAEWRRPGTGYNARRFWAETRGPPHGADAVGPKANEGRTTMGKTLTRWRAGRAMILAVGALLAVASPAAASSTPWSSQTRSAAACGISPQQVKNSAASLHASGIVFAQTTSTSGRCHKPPAEPPFNGTPPLLFQPSHCIALPCFHGEVMMTASTGTVVVVPIFWIPSGY